MTDDHLTTHDADEAATATGLPPGWTTRDPRPDDAPTLHALRTAHESAVTGTSSTEPAEIEAALTDTRGVRRHLLLLDADEVVRGWVQALDRAAGRVVVSLTLDPALEPSLADVLAGVAFAWADGVAVHVARARGLSGTQVDSGADATSTRQQDWLRAAGYRLARSWLQMTRPTAPADQDRVPADGRDGLRVRPVRRGADGTPDRLDLVTVHDVLEQAFTDHFNHRPETADEFLARLSDAPGHRWDHWWLAETEDADGWRPAGAVVGTVSPGRDGAPDGTYLAYLGVLRSARGRGTGRALLDAVVGDAARRGRDRVALEVDADSPTGAVRLYTAAGFRTSSVTQSWHRELTWSDGAA